MIRRKFITLVGGAAAVWPVATRAQQQAAMPVIGFLHSATPAPFVRHVAAFRDGLSENGYVEGRNATIEYRWAEGQYDRLPALAADLVGRQVAVLVALGPTASLVAKAATPTIPVVFSTGDDPVKVGLVTNLSRPEGNVTGVHIFTGELEPKRLGLLSQMAPQAGLIGFLVNSGSLQLENSGKGRAGGGLRDRPPNLGRNRKQSQGFQTRRLPVFRLTRFEFVINLNTAKALGIDVPPGLSAMADEVIE